MTMEKTKNSEYIFQRRKITFTKKLFKSGLSAGSYLLLGLEYLGESFVDDFIGGLPSSYPGFKLMKMMCGCDSKKGLKKFDKNTIKINVSRLKKQGLIAQGENKKIHLTANGKEMILYVKDRYSVLEKPWDGKIRIVIFDVAEKQRRSREWLRIELLLLQFKQLQKSVYVGKYPISDELYKDIIKNEIFKDVFVFTVDQVDKEDELLKFLENDER